MATAPKFLGPDGVLRQDYQFTTTLSDRFFTGTMDADTVDMQVSVRGSVFASDPDLITFEGSSFTIPNPSAYPDGLRLFQGDNVIWVKSILSNGSATGDAKVTATLSTDKDLSVSVDAPTGIYIEQQDSTVQVYADGLEVDEVQGYHFYASPSPGGGQEGYFRINPSMVISGETVENIRTIGTLEVDANVATTPGGDHAADPLYFRVQGTQTDRLEVLLQSDFDESIEVPETADRVRVETVVQTVRELTRFSFVHDRQATLSSVNAAVPHSALSSVPLEDPLYYVVTAVYFVEGVEIESPFSPEVAGYPLIVTPSVGAFPSVSRQQVTDAVITSIYRSHPQMKVEPGSVVRDTFIDPFSTEAQRIRFVIQFLHDAQSFATLLRIDDPSFSGVSIPVSQSSYKQAIKQAFYLASDADVQALIDNAFDKLASNWGITRRGGNRSRGEVTFSVSSQPSSDIPLAIGTVVLAGGVRFRTTSSATIQTTGQGRNYDPLTGKFYARAYIQAEEVGADGVVASGQIRSLENNLLGIQVTNEGPTFGGQDRESNRDLAIRAQGALASVDSGTLQGYNFNAADQAGVSQVQVIEAGHALMMRDRNPLTGNHSGGKVDIWVRTNPNIADARATDAFAFGFEIARDIQFIPVGLLTNLRFKALDARLTEDNPIIEMMDYPDAGLKFEDATQGFDFDLTGATYPSYNEVQLSSAYNDPTLHNLTDIFFGAYRYRTSNQFVLTRQPPVAITSLTGTVSGLISDNVYGLYRASDPLVLGRSAEAGDYLMVTEPLNPDTGETIPSSEPVIVEGEVHVILEGIEYLNNLGANPYTLRIYNNDRTVEYYGPFHNTGVQDWRYIDGDGTTPSGIELTETSRISVGQTVLFDYYHDENFVVEYTYTSVIGVTQNAINGIRHITADVLVKGAVETPVDITATIVLQPRQTKSRVDALLKSNLSQLFGLLALGDALYLSDVIRVLDQTVGVSHVITPLTKMTRGDGALIVREPLTVSVPADVTKLDAWSSPTVYAYLIEDDLENATTDAGGETTDFRGVFQDEGKLVHIESMPNAVGYPLRSALGQAFIIGSGGAEILGFSDDATLQALYPFATATELLEKRVEITANRVVVTVAPGDSPVNHEYTVTYTVQGDTGVKSIDPGPVEYLVAGEYDFTYDSETGTR